MLIVNKNQFLYTDICVFMDLQLLMDFLIDFNRHWYRKSRNNCHIENNTGTNWEEELKSESAHVYC